MGVLGRFTAATVGAALAMACTSPVRDYAEPHGAGGASGASTGSGNACQDSQHSCVAAAPSGWAGPLLLTEGTPQAPPPACIGAYGKSQGDYNGQLDAGTADCKCTCDPAKGITCTAPASLCYVGSVIQCNQFCMTQSGSVPPNVCTAINPSAASYSQVSGPAPTDIGSCKAVPAHTLPKPVWGVAAKACTAAADPTTAGCASGNVCAPNAAAPGKLCVAHPGDVACEGAFYGAKQLLYEGFMDTRACSDCSCGMAKSACGGQVAFITGSGCNGFLQNAVSSPGCGQKNNGMTADHALYSPDPKGTCDPSPSMLSGEVVTTGAATFCCHTG